MKRLSEEMACDHLTARAQALIHATGPTLESEPRLLRVRRALDAPRRSALGSRTARWGIVAALSTAGAAAGWGALHTSPTPPPADAASYSPSAPAGMPAWRPAPPKAAEELVPSASALPPVDGYAPPPRSNPVRVPASVASSDVARIHEAARALRRDRDPARALALLERQPVAPGSPLAEESLALRIQASSALQNGRQARLAASYLKLYPQGRYRELAQRALSGP